VCGVTGWVLLSFSAFSLSTCRLLCCGPLGFLHPECVELPAGVLCYYCRLVESRPDVTSLTASIDVVAVVVIILVLLTLGPMCLVKD
jgi:hypothetical protein